MGHYLPRGVQLALAIYDRKLTDIEVDYISVHVCAAIECVWQVGIQPARQRKSNHFGSEIQPPYCSAIALSNVANGNSAHHA